MELYLDDSDAVHWQSALGEGEVEINALDTPYLDRLDRLCHDAGLSRVTYLDIAKTYAAQNEIAHHACVQPVGYSILTRDQ